MTRAMIVDSTFFFGPLRIEGYGSATRTGDAIAEEMQRYIALYECRYLRLLLGKELAAEFAAYLEQEDKEPEPRWEKLLSALVPVPCVSPIANYVFFYYVRRNQRSVTPLGVTETNSDNKVVSCDFLTVGAWNDMVDMNRDVACFLQGNAGDYPGLMTDDELLTKINVLSV